MSKAFDELRKKAKRGGRFRDPSEKVEFHTTGSLILDVGIGGGYPARRITEIYGPENSGKTSLCIVCCAASVEMGEKVCWIDAEGSLEFEWCQRLGLDVYAVDEDGERLFNTYMPYTAEAGLQFLKDTIELASDPKTVNDAPDVIVLDSLAKLSASGEQEAEFDRSARMAEVTSMLTRLCRVLAAPLDKALKPITIIYVNQMRDNFEAATNKYVDKKRSFGGNAIRHEASIRLQLLPTTETWNDKKAGDYIKELFIRPKLKKTKVSDFNKEMHLVALELQDDDSYFINHPREAFELAKRFGLLKTAKGTVFAGSGGAFFDMKTETGDTETVSLGVGEAKILAAIGQNFDLLIQMRAAIIEAWKERKLNNASGGGTSKESDTETGDTEGVEDTVVGGQDEADDQG
jgi:RecA/RadA recombinase